MAITRRMGAIFIVLTALDLFASPVLANNYIVHVSVNTNGKVTLDHERVPDSGGLNHGDHVKWTSDKACHLDVTIFDHDIKQPEHWLKPDDHGHSNEADVDTPKKILGADRIYLYAIRIWCDSGVKGSADPELVVAGGGFDQHKLGGAKGIAGMPPHQPVVDIKIDVHGNSASVDQPSALVYTDQLVHWGATGGNVTRVSFADGSVGDVPCSHNDCNRTVYDLTPGYHYKYSIVVVDPNGEEHVTDPEIVVGGGQPSFKTRRRMAKE